MNTSILIATPTYNGSVWKEYTKSVIELTRELSSKNIEYEIIIEEGTILHVTRNLMASRALLSTNTHLLFIDSDISFDAKAVLAMIDAEKDVIGAIYPRRQLPLTEPIGTASASNDYLINWLPKHYSYVVRNPKEPKDGELIEVESLGAGLLLISKSTLKKLSESGKAIEYAFNGEASWYAGDHFYGFFDYLTIEQQIVTEDFSFCERWRSVDGKIYALVSAEISHFGSCVFRGSFTDTESF